MQVALIFGEGSLASLVESNSLCVTSRMISVSINAKRSPFELDSGIRENGAQANGGNGHVTTQLDG